MRITPDPDRPLSGLRPSAIFVDDLDAVVSYLDDPGPADASPACDHRHTLADPHCVKCGAVVGRLRAIVGDMADAPAVDGRPE